MKFWRRWAILPEMDGFISTVGIMYRPTRYWALHVYTRMERKRGRYRTYGIRWVVMRADHPELL